MNGAVFYDGPSLLTGDPIVAVVTGLELASGNSKTGAMCQAYILRSDIDPSEAVANGGDLAICGDCRHRGQGELGRSCYVTWWQAPFNVYRAYKKGKYHVMPPSALARTLRGRQLRFGAYGDPAAVPVLAWEILLSKLAGWTGYTHQWTTCDPRFKRFLMASVDNPDEYAAAHAQGWRTFRSRPKVSDIFEGEVICPASEEANHSTTCLECNLCRGADRPAKSVAIIVHGQRARWFEQPRVPGAPRLTWHGRRIPSAYRQQRVENRFTTIENTPALHFKRSMLPRLVKARPPVLDGTNSIQPKG